MAHYKAESACKLIKLSYALVQDDGMCQNIVARKTWIILNVSRNNQIILSKLVSFM